MAQGSAWQMSTSPQVHTLIFGSAVELSALGCHPVYDKAQRWPVATASLVRPVTETPSSSSSLWPCCAAMPPCPHLVAGCPCTSLGPDIN